MLVTNIALNTKIGEVENKTPHHELYIITQELNKWTSEHFSARLKPANVTKFCWFCKTDRFWW